MSVLGRKPIGSPISSADIATGGILASDLADNTIEGTKLADDITFSTTGSITPGSLKQVANRDLSGTYTEHEMLIADDFTLTGDITVSDNLVLSKLSDDGNAITLTPTSPDNITISGSGSIETSTLAQTPQTSLTGMTGVINSAVTGSPNLNLGNVDKATFPSGHLIRTSHISIGKPYTSGNIYRLNNTSNPPGVETDSAFRITCSNIPEVSNKLIEVTYSLRCFHNNHPNWYVVYSWDNSSWVKAPYGRGASDETGDGGVVGNNPWKYPHATGAYDTDQNTTNDVNVNATWTDSSSSNTTLYTRLYWGSQNSTDNVFINRTIGLGTSHGYIANSHGWINIYQV